jgi:hypothetical protein
MVASTMTRADFGDAVVGFAERIAQRAVEKARG